MPNRTLGMCRKGHNRDKAWGRPVARAAPSANVAAGLLVSRVQHADAAPRAVERIEERVVVDAGHAEEEVCAVQDQGLDHGLRGRPALRRRRPRTMGMPRGRTGESTGAAARMLCYRAGLSVQVHDASLGL